MEAKLTYVIEWRNKTSTGGERKEKPMRTKRAFPQVIKQIPRDAQRDDSEQAVRELTQTKEGKAL